MAFARKYSTSEVRTLMRSSEGSASPVTGKAAHSRTLHARSVGGGEGTSHAGMMHRTHKAAGESNNQFGKRGGTSQTSAFKNILQQSSAVAQALNSRQGQAALRVFDRGASAHLGLRATIVVSDIREAGFLPASGASQLSTVHKNDAGVATGASGGVRVIIDRGPGASSFTVQTCFPLGAGTVSAFEVRAIPGGMVLGRG